MKSNANNKSNKKNQSINEEEISEDDKEDSQSLQNSPIRMPMNGGDGNSLYKIHFENKRRDYDKLFIKYGKLDYKNKQLEKLLQEKEKKIHFFEDNYKLEYENKKMVNKEEPKDSYSNCEKLELINIIKRKDEIIEKQKRLLKEMEKDNKKLQNIVNNYNKMNFNENKKFAMMEENEENENIIENIIKANPNFISDDNSQFGTIPSSNLRVNFGYNISKEKDKY